MPGICVNMDGDINRKMKYYLTHMIKEISYPKIPDMWIGNTGYILRETIVL